MNVTRLRAIMRRYHGAGVLLVGAYLVGHSLWHKRRVALLTTLFALLVLTCRVGGIRKGSGSASKRLVPSLSVVLPTDPSELIYRPQQPLLPHARQITALNAYYCAHLWISSERLLLVTSAQPTSGYNGVDVFPSEWQGQATLLDLRAGQRHKLDGLTSVFHRMHAMPDSFETSPGGKWLKWINRETGDGYPNSAVAQWDGSAFQQWQQDKASDTYWLDDHRWVEEERRSYDEKRSPKCVILHDADRKQTTTFVLNSKAGQKLVRAYHTADGNEFVPVWDHEATQTPTVLISEEKSFEDAEDATLSVPTYTIGMPPGAEVRQVLVSPKSRRVLYVLYFRQVAEAIRPQPKYGVFDIWTSRLDGSGLKELGYVESGELEYSNDRNPQTAQNMIDLEWLPEGRQFSFIYRGKLYRAAGD